MIGTSAAETSTIALSIPRPANADSRCSTVETRDSPLPRVVPSMVSPTFSAVARMSTMLRQIGAPEDDALIRVGRAQGHEHLLAGVQADAGGANRVFKRPLTDHACCFAVTPQAYSG